MEIHQFKYDNENYYQLCTKKILIAIDSHYHIDFEVFLYIVISNIIQIELLKILFQMSLNRVCFNCGSSSFVSDRSLGGKIVCSKCGSSSFKNKSSSFLKNKKLVFLAIAIAIFIIVIQIICLYSKVHYFQPPQHQCRITY